VNLADYGYSRDYAHQCAAWTGNSRDRARKQCGLTVAHNIAGWIYLCARHYEIIEREFEQSIDTLNSQRVANLQERLSRQETAAKLAAEPDPWVEAEIVKRDRQRKEQTVYFMRCQEYVKIGISMNPAARLQQIRRGGGSHFPRLLDVETTELVATEPGGLDRERELHKKFHKLRHTGEWFTETPQLTKYINSLIDSEAAA